MQARGRWCRMQFTTTPVDGSNETLYHGTRSGVLCLIIRDGLRSPKKSHGVTGVWLTDHMERGFCWGRTPLDTFPGCVVEGVTAANGSARTGAGKTSLAHALLALTVVIFAGKPRRYLHEGPCCSLHYMVPGKQVAQNWLVFGLNDGLLWGIVVHYFGLSGFRGRYLHQKPFCGLY